VFLLVVHQYVPVKHLLREHSVQLSTVTFARPAQLVALLTRYFVALTSYAVQYTPFTSPSLRNPCITLLGRTTNTPALQLTYKQASTGLTETPQRWCVMEM
jgi:hypothetical protein